jgi:hypothetical protein
MLTYTCEQPTGVSRPADPAPTAVDIASTSTYSQGIVRLGSLLWDSCRRRIANSHKRSSSAYIAAPSANGIRVNARDLHFFMCIKYLFTFTAFCSIFLKQNNW